MRFDLEIEEVLLLLFLFSVAAATAAVMPIAILWFGGEVARSVWSLRRRLPQVVRISIVLGAVAWFLVAVFLGFALGGALGTALFAYLIGIGIIVLGHA